MTPAQEKIARAANQVEERLRWISPGTPLAIAVRGLLDAVADGLKAAQLKEGNECADCPMASPDECLSASYCEHRDGAQQEAKSLSEDAQA